MQLIIEIDDAIEADLRHAFAVQDQDATDEQIVEVVRTYLITTAAHVIESEERAAAAERKARMIAGGQPAKD